MSEQTEAGQTAMHGDGGGAGMAVDGALVRELAELLGATGLSEIEVVDGARKIRVVRQISAAPAPVAAPAPLPAAPPAAAPVAPQPELSGHVIKSPMVGTAYLASEPGAASFVTPGQSVKAGDTLLIIEAMKVMNPILATAAGTVSKVMVENGQPVEFDQPLVVIA